VARLEERDFLTARRPIVLSLTRVYHQSAIDFLLNLIGCVFVVQAALYMFVFGRESTMITPVADYPLGRIGSCLRPAWCGGPARSKKSEKNVLLKHVFHSFIISKLLCIVFMLDVHVFVKQHKLVDLVQYV